MNKKGKKIFITDLKAGDEVRDLFLVKRKNKSVARNGKPYLNLLFADKTGDIEARVWDRADELDKFFDVDDFVGVEARANEYKGQIQLVVVDVSKIDSALVDTSDFLKTSDKNPKELIESIKNELSGLQDNHLRKLVFAFLEDDNFIELFKNAPAATTVHHAYIGGLAEHVLSLLVLAKKICSHYPMLNRDILMSGVFFHDLGKIKEISASRSFQYTDEGKLLGHIIIGCEMVAEKAKEIEGFPKETELLIKHMITAHHGEIEFGSPKVPHTLEALILHYLDNIDAKVNTISQMMEAAKDNPWTDYNKFIGRDIYNRVQTPKSVTETKSRIPKITKPSKKASTKKKESKKNQQEQELELFE